MITEKNKLAEDLIVNKMKTLTEDIYAALEGLPCAQFGTVISMLMTIWCDHNGINIFRFLETLIIAIPDEPEDINMQELSL